MILFSMNVNCAFTFLMMTFPAKTFAVSTRLEISSRAVFYRGGYNMPSLEVWQEVMHTPTNT